MIQTKENPSPRRTQSRTHVLHTVQEKENLKRISFVSLHVLRLPPAPRTARGARAVQGGQKPLFALLILILASLACNVAMDGKPTPEPSPVSVKLTSTPLALPSPTPAPTSKVEASATETPVVEPAADSIPEHHWASRSFADPETVADPDMADGEPDVTECGDTLRAWAPPTSTNPAILTLTYTAPLLPTQVNIVQSGNPGGILRVEVLDSASGLGRLIYEGEKEKRIPSEKCPDTLSLPVKTDFAVDTIIVTIAASDSPTQIDAVELVGSLPAFVDVPMFWQVSIPSDDPPAEFGLPGGIAVDNLGNFHLAEGAHGVYTYDVEGNPVKTIPASSNSDLTDVTADLFGNLIVTDSGYGRFIVLSPKGAQIVAGGDDFAAKGPFAVALSPQDGNLYLLDEARIRLYTSDTATYLRDLPLEPGSYNGLAFDTEGNLYTASLYGESVLKIDPSNGEILDTLGVPALAKTTSRDLALDEAGNIYVLVNSSPGDTAVYMLDPHGNLLKRFVRLVYQPPEGERPEGVLFDPLSLAVTPDGRFLVVCDAFGNTTFLTAFKLSD
jgi:DNA-binding beta-propeller fold protein YncE